MDQSPRSSMEAPATSHNMVNSKIMVVAVVVLFAVVMFILCLHVYAKWFWRNQGGMVVASDGTILTPSWRRRRYRGDPRVHMPNATTMVTQTVGLERAVVEALPTFEYSVEDMKEGLECAVCLEEFEEGERGRTLPKCGHNFHLGCVDMWLHSHSTCPLCRTSVGDEDVKQVEALVVQTREELQAEEGAAAVVGDVGAPFMAAMRASRRQRRRSRRQLPSVSSPMGVNSLPRTIEDSENHGQREGSGTDSAPTADREVVATVLQQSLKDYETPSTDAPATSGSSIRAPFQVTIDIPRAGAVVGSNSVNVLSPMARASASFRRLLSRGKSVVTPQSPPEGADEGGPSSSPRAPSPRPPSV